MELYRGRGCGKSFKGFFELKNAIELGSICSVATANPNKFKMDFENAVGIKLYLEKSSTGFYTATLNKQT